MSSAVVEAPPTPANTAPCIAAYTAIQLKTLSVP